MRGSWTAYREAIAPLVLLGLVAAAVLGRLLVDTTKAWTGG